MKQFSTSRNFLSFFSKRATSIISKIGDTNFTFFLFFLRGYIAKRKAISVRPYPLRIQKGSERRRFTLISRNEGPLGREGGTIKMESLDWERARADGDRVKWEMHERKGSQLTVVGVVEVDDFLPSVISHCVDDSAMIIRTHAYGEIQETGGRCQNL